MSDFNYDDKVLDWIDEHADDLDNGLLDGSISLTKWLLQGDKESGVLFGQSQLILFLLNELEISWEKLLSLWDNKYFNIFGSVPYGKYFTGDVILPDGGPTVLSPETLWGTAITSFTSNNSNPLIIERGAFKDCNNLVSVKLRNCSRIEDDAFKGCSSLSEVILPDGLKDIDEGVFRNCTNLKVLELPTTLKWLGSATIDGDTKLKFRGLDREQAKKLLIKFRNDLTLTDRNFEYYASRLV